MKKSILPIVVLVLLFSCSDLEMYDKINGEWECATWLNIPKNLDKCNDNVYFKFESDKTYQSIIGNIKDSGDFIIEGGLLYVTPKGKMEFAVKINKLNEDTLIFKMNQAGDEEILTLLRIVRN